MVYIVIKLNIVSANIRGMNDFKKEEQFITGFEKKEKKKNDGKK